MSRPASVDWSELTLPPAAPLPPAPAPAMNELSSAFSIASDAAFSAWQGGRGRGGGGGVHENRGP